LTLKLFFLLAFATTVTPVALGAMVGEGVAEITHGTLDTKTAAHVGKFSGSLAAAAVDVAQGLDGVKGLSIGAATASTAVENNFMRHAVLAAYRLAKSKMGRKALEKVAEKLPKRLKDYIREVELKSGVKVTPKQRELLAKDLRENGYKRLDKEAYDLHRNNFTKPVRERLIDQWEKMGGTTKVREWPSVPKFDKTGRPVINSETGLQEMVRHQAHHITPQQLGGKHEWWNMHPIQQSAHQGGVHGSGSVLNSILKGLK
jgi:hypothetical protein